MRVALSASMGALLFSLTAGIAAGYLHVVGTGASQQPPFYIPPPYLGLATLVSFAAQYVAPIVFFFWLGRRSPNLNPLGQLVAGILLASFAGRSLGTLAIAGSSLGPSYASVVLDSSIPFFLLCLGTLSVSYLWKAGTVRRAPLAKAS